MDEFLYSENIKNYLIDFHNSESTIVKPSGYDMIIENFIFDYDKKLTDLVKTGFKNNHFDKLVMFKPKKINFNIKK